MKVNTAHCFFEQSGTFKNEFKKLGINAYDYDIQNEFGQTDNIIDLFEQIELAYDNNPSIFDKITSDDLIVAFFPCIYFSALQMHFYTGHSFTFNKLSQKEKSDAILQRITKRDIFYKMLYKLFFVCEARNLKLIVENPASPPHYLLFTQNFYRPPTFIDYDRTRRGDCFNKPTAWWFFNCDATYGESFVSPKEIKKIRKTQGSKGGICSKERSMMTPTYARNFICDFILGQPNENTKQTTLF